MADTATDPNVRATTPVPALLTTATALTYRCILIDTSNLKAGRVDEDGNALPDKATERDMAAFSALVPFLPMSGSEMYEVSVRQQSRFGWWTAERSPYLVSK